MSTTRHRLAAALAAVVSVTACAGDDDASSTVPDIPAPPTTADPLFTTTIATTTVATTPPSTAAPITEAPPATTEPPATSTVPSTDASTTVAEPTTSAPSTTAADPDVQAVVDGLVASWNAVNEARLDPFDDDRVVQIRETHEGPLVDVVLESIEDFRLRNLRSVTNPAAPAAILPDVSTVTIESNVASVSYCWINTNTVVETDGGENGEDVVLDDDVSVSLVSESFVLMDGRWKKTGGEILQTVEGAVSCDALA